MDPKEVNESSPLIPDVEAASQEDNGDETSKFKISLKNDITRPAKRGVNALQLTMMIYFFTSGGPFGIESAVGAGGPLLTLISLLVIPTIWSLPQAILSAELSLLIPENGGNVVWVQHAFGDFIGWFNAYNCLVQSFSSNALLVVLFVDYIPYTFTTLQSWLIKFGFILFNTVFNLLGLRWISRLSLVFLLFVLSPFVAEIVLILLRHELNVEALKFIPPAKDIDWGVFFSTVIWSYGGFDQMGSLAGEVKGGSATFVKGITGSFPLLFLNYFVPIFVGYSVDTNYKNWTSGYFTPLAYKLTEWLGVWMVVASAVSNFGQFNAAMATLSRSVWSLARPETGGGQMLPWILGWSWQRHTGTVRPIAAILFVAAMTMILTGLPFDVLVQLFLLIRVCNLVCEYAALIKLRYSRAEEPRPFKVPGGKFGVWILGIPSALLAGFTLVNADWQVWAAGGITNVVILVAYGIKVLVQRRSAAARKAVN